MEALPSAEVVSTATGVELSAGKIWELCAGDGGGIWIDDFDFEIGGQRRYSKKHQRNQGTKDAHAILLNTRKGLLWWRFAPVSWLRE